MKMVQNRENFRPAPDLSTLRSLFYAAAPIAPERLERCLEAFGPILIQTYGTSEMIGGLTFLSKEDHALGAKRLASCGRPSLCGEVIVADEDGQQVEPGVQGEIFLRGPSLMAEYWRDPEVTEVAFMAGGWFRSGDMGRTDEEGYVYLIDRGGDKVVTGGINVLPLGVEHELMSHPDVLGAAVIGVPDPKWGEAVKGIVRLRSGSDIQAEELRAWLRGNLASHQVPKSIDFVNHEWPRTPTGKLLRRDLKGA